MSRQSPAYSPRDGISVSHLPYGNYELRTAMCWLKKIFGKKTAAQATLPASPSSTVNVAVINHSTVVNNDRVARWTAAVAKQVARDVAPIWGVSANIQFVTAPPTDSTWQVIVCDDSDQAGALGYHEALTPPRAFVFARDDLRYGMQPNVTLSHEILEMLADPEANQGWTVGSDFYIREICDPTQADRDGYAVDNVWVSNFVTPDWGVPGSRGPWDFRRLMTRPLELRPGGYISVYRNGSWHQIFGEILTGATAFRTRSTRVHTIIRRPPPCAK